MMRLAPWKTAVICAVLGVSLAVPCLVASLVAEQTRWETPPLDFSQTDVVGTSNEIRRLGPHLWSLGGLPVVVAWGAPGEMGRQYGAAVAAAIRQGRDAYLYEHLRDEEGYGPDYLHRCAKAMLPHIAQEYREEMQGVAEGSGVSYEDILALHLHADVVHHGHDWGERNSARTRNVPGCSNFAVWGAATIDGKLRHGRNLDWTTGTRVQEIAVVDVGIPQRGYPFALVTYAGMVGGVTGMNAAGITFGEMTSSTDDETLDGEPLFFICRRLLQYCGTISDVEKMVHGYQGTTGWNFLVSSGRERTARAFEVDGKDVVTFRPNDPQEMHPPVSRGSPWALIRTNHPVSDKMQRKVARKYGVKSLALGRIALRSMDTWQRYESLRQWITKDHFGRVEDRLARAMLQTKPVAANNNLHSVLFLPEDLKMWVANAAPPPTKQPAYTQPYHLVELSLFLETANLAPPSLGQDGKPRE